MGNNIQVCQPSLTRDSYFPGNPIQGSVRVVATDNVEYYAIRAAIVGVYWCQYEERSGNHSRTVTSTNVFSKTVITVAGDTEQVATGSKKKHQLPKGEHHFPFQCILSPATLPTAACQSGSDKSKIFWEVVGEVDVAGRLNQAGKVAFTVYSPVPKIKHDMPSQASIQQDFPVRCCCHCCCPACCCSHGKIHATAAIDRSCIALDRDRVNFTISVDNTDSTEQIVAVNAVLQCSVIPKIGPKKVRPQQVFFNKKIPVTIEGGKVGQVTGVIELTPGAPPTITSSVVDFRWTFTAIVEESGCMTVNPRVPIDVELYHTVDDTGAAQYIMQQQFAFQPIMNAADLDRRGVYEVPNMSNANFANNNGMTMMMSPAANAFYPPPPPQQGIPMQMQPPQGYGTVTMSNIFICIF